MNSRSNNESSSLNSSSLRSSSLRSSSLRSSFEAIRILGQGSKVAAGPGQGQGGAGGRGQGQDQHGSQRLGNRLQNDYNTVPAVRKDETLTQIRCFWPRKLGSELTPNGIIWLQIIF